MESSHLFCADAQQPAAEYKTAEQPVSRIPQKRFFKSKTTSIFAHDKQHIMKKTILLTVLFCNILLSFAGDTKTKSDLKSASIGFTENKGQIVDQNNNPNPHVKYLFAGNGLNLQLRQSGFSYDVWSREGKVNSHKTDLLNSISEENVTYKLHRIDFDFQNSNSTATINANSPFDGYSNYYTTGTNDNRATQVKSFREVIYKNVWQNIDIAFLVSDIWVKYNIILNPGANIADVKFNISGADKIIEQNGNLLLQNSVREIHETIPYSFIENQNSKTEIKVSFKKIADNIYGFSIAEPISKDSKVVIDPMPNLLWATYFGGSDEDDIMDITSDGAGNIYICGITLSPSNVATVGSHQNTIGGNYDAFVSKLNSSGFPQWSTYYGGSPYDGADGIALDASDNVFATGFTKSTTGIATAGAHLATYGGGTGGDAFLVKFNNSGVRQWGTYFGQNATGKQTSARSVACNGNTEVAISGFSTSSSGVATAGAHQQTFGGGTISDAFLAKFSNAGSLQWATYYGGSDNDGYDSNVGFDLNGNIYLSARTESSNAIATAGAYQTTIVGASVFDFLVKFNTNGVRQWATYFGGDVGALPHGLAIDGNANILLTGYTNSVTGIATVGAYQDTLVGGYDCYIAKFNSSGSIQWSTYYGGADQDNVFDIATDISGNAYLTGFTRSSTGIVTDGAYQTNISGGQYRAFATKFNANGNLSWGTYLGGNDTYGYGVTVNSAGNIFIAGQTAAVANFITPGAYQTSFGGNPTDGFVAKFENGCFYSANANTPLCSGQTLNLSTSSGVSYNWSGPNAFSSSQQNPNIPSATNLNAGNYSVTVIDGNGCTSTDNVTVAVNPLPLVSASSNSPLCVGQTLNLSSSGGAQYSWTGANSYSSSQQNPTRANIVLADSGGYTVIVTDSNGCSQSANVNVVVNSLPVPTVSISASICSGSTLNLNSSGGSSYSWSGPNGFNSSQQNPSINNVSAANSGSYSVTVTDVNSCSASISSSTSVFVTPVQQLCVVTVDSNSTHNVIVWEKPNDLSAYDSFFVYREITTNNYQKIGSVYRDSLSSYDDFGSNPNQQAYRYKITTLDTCGNEGSLDSTDYHNSIHLQYLANGNFIWNEYRIEGQGTVVSSYNVWRDALGNGNWLQIGTVAGTQTTFTDPTYSSFTNPIYRVDVSWISSHVCTPTRASVNTSLSNAKAITQTGINNISSNEVFKVYPNPSSGLLSLYFKANPVASIEISLLNTIGQIVYSENHEFTKGEIKNELNLSNYSEGIYLLRVKAGDSFSYSKVIIAF